MYCIINSSGSHRGGFRTWIKMLSVGPIIKIRWYWYMNVPVAFCLNITDVREFRSRSSCVCLSQPTLCSAAKKHQDSEHEVSQIIRYHRWVDQNKLLFCFLKGTSLWCKKTIQLYQQHGFMSKINHHPGPLRVSMLQAQSSSEYWRMMTGVCTTELML